MVSPFFYFIFYFLLIILFKTKTKTKKNETELAVEMLEHYREHYLIKTSTNSQANSPHPSQLQHANGF